ncbi:MAG: aldehyde ferredoxin oxidoreductase, partial [Dehalococcoidia bacterium]|nr:aldehyde ferredoxin oxidoreductase [Dehalococcoidia bacterium]
MTTGYTGRILIVNLTSGKVSEEQLQEGLYRHFIGGVGLGTRLLHEYQPAKVNPLGEQNILGFMPGLLSGTAVPLSARLSVVSKSPLTGGWGDANVGGHIAHELKCAGYDGILVQGISPRPVYLLIYAGRAELRDASHLWGKDTRETEDTLRKEIGDRSLRVACIGPAGEAQSLISAIITEAREGGRAAARSGLGAVMGSKRLKAVAVRGQNRVPVADSARVGELRREFVNANKDAPIFAQLKTGGTAGSTQPQIIGGVTPFKNWSLSGAEAMPSYEPFEDRINKYLLRRHACAGCPVGCKGILKPEETGIGECGRPEYETIAGFGPNCLNSDVGTILKANELCNHHGMDTISASTAIAFAIDCYERGIITKQ